MEEQPPPKRKGVGSNPIGATNYNGEIAMHCPKCGDEITGVFMQMTVHGVIYKEEDNDLSSYPQLEHDIADPDTLAECGDCGHEAELRAFFPGDANA